jgi:hypothetical protein
MSRLQRVLDGAIAPGIYRFPSKAQPETLAAEAEAQGWRTFYLDGAQIIDKASLLGAARTAFAMPDYAGNNWDAFEELVNDLSWAPAAGYVVVFDDAANLAEHDPASWGVLMDIFNCAIKEWAKEDKPMYVLVRGAGRSDEQAPWPAA